MGLAVLAPLDQPISSPARSDIWKWPHAKAELVQGRIHIPGHHAVIHQPVGLGLSRKEDAVAHESRGTHPPAWPLCRWFWPVSCRWRPHHRPCDPSRTISSNSFITLAGEKKCKPITSSRAVCDTGNLVNIQGRGVCGQNRTGFHHPVQLGEYLLFQVHVFKHGFNHQIAIGQEPQ